MLYLTFIHTKYYLTIHCIGKSFVELVHYLFTVPGVKSFLSQRLCQDPLENFFGCQRQRGGVHDNPNVLEFTKNTQALRVINHFCKGPVKGNCRGGHSESLDKENFNEPLPKRPRQSSSRKHLGLYWLILFLLYAISRALLCFYYIIITNIQARFFSPTKL